ncbi:MAG: precorrin-6A synthase (deacetylating) [Pseudomonadota bacterium]
MYDLALVGIASGSPDHLTAEARRALSEADVILIPQKGAEKAELAGVRTALLGDLGAAPRAVPFEMPVRDEAEPDYLQRVEDWHDRIAGLWADALGAALPRGGKAAIMIWGDPSLYDSSLRIAEQLPGRGIEVVVRVIPGITSLQLLTAAHGIPLNDLGAPVLITTGRRLREGWPPGVERLVVMLDGSCSFTQLPEPERYRIWWGAYLGMAGEILCAGRLDEVAEDIVARRAATRADRGWIMDVYLLEQRGEVAA